MERKKLFNKACTRFKRRKRIELAKTFKTLCKNVKFPTFKIEKNPTINISKVKARCFYIIDRAQIKAKEKWAREKDRNIFNLINDLNVTGKRIDANPLKQKRKK